MYSRYESREGSPSRRSQAEDQYYHKTILRYEADIRRLTDQLNLALIKARRFQQLQDKYQGLIRQNSTLSQQNQNLILQLNEKKRQIDLLRCQYEENALRDEQRLNYARDIKSNLQQQIQMLKKTNNQSCLLYQQHINKLERLIQDRTRQGEELAIKLQKFRSQSQYQIVRQQDQKNKLKSDIQRNQYQKQIQLDHLRSKLVSSTELQLDTIKKAHYSQIAVLQEQINKFRNLSTLKDHQVQRMLQQNINMKNSYEAQILNLRKDADILRQKLLMQQKAHHQQLDVLRLKYASLHTNDTENLKSSYSNQSKLLLTQLDKLKGLITQKTIDIQNLYRQKNQQRQHYDKQLAHYQQQLQLIRNKMKTIQAQKSREISSLNSQLQFQMEKGRAQNANQSASQQYLQKKVKQLTNQYAAKSQQADQINADLISKKQQLQDINSRNKQQLEKLRHDHQAQVKNKNRQIQILNNSMGNDKAKTNQELIQSQEQKINLQNQNKRLNQKLKQAQEEEERNQKRLNSITQQLRACQQDLNNTKIAGINRQNNCNRQLQQLSSNLNRNSKSFQQQLKKAYQMKILSLNQQNDHLKNLLNQSKKRVQKIVQSYQGFIQQRQSQGKRRENAGFQQISHMNFMDVISRSSRQSFLPIL